MNTNERIIALRVRQPEWTQRKIAQTLGISETAVSRHLKNYINESEKDQLKREISKMAKNLKEVSEKVAQLERNLRHHRHNQYGQVQSTR